MLSRIFKKKSIISLSEVITVLFLLGISSNANDTQKTLLEQGILLFEINEIDDCIDELTDAVEIDSSNYKAYLIRGKAHYFNREYELAIKDCETVLILNHNNPTALIFKILSLNGIGDSNVLEGIDKIDMESKDNEILAEGYYYRAWAKISFLDDEIGGLSDSDSSISILPTEKAYHNRGIVKLDLCDTTGAIEDLLNETNLFGQREDILSLYSLGKIERLMGDIYRKKGNKEKHNNCFRKAYDYFTRALDIIQFADGYYYRSFINATKKMALDDLLKAIELKGRRPRYHFWAGCYSIYSAKMSDSSGENYYLEALEYFNKAIELLPNARYFEDKGGYYLRRGSVHLDLENYKEALSDFESFREIEPEDSYPYVLKGMVMRELNDYAGSLRELSRAIELEPDDVVAFWQRGLTKIKLGDNEGALADLNKVIELDPSFAESDEYKNAILEINSPGKSNSE